MQTPDRMKEVHTLEQQQILEQTPAPHIPALSQSRQSKMACPHLYRVEYIEKRGLPMTPYAQRGIEVHAFIEHYLKHLVSTNQPSDWTYFDKLLASGGYGRDASKIVEGMRESLVIDPQRILAIEPFMALDADLEPIEVDLDVDAHVYQKNPPANAAFCGIPDVLESPDPETVICRDWKSYFAIVEPESFQSELYPLLIFKTYPAVQRVVFELFFVRYNASRVVEYTRGNDLEKLERIAKRERVKQEILHTAADLAAYGEGEDRKLGELDLKSQAGAHCAYCPFLDESVKALAQGKPAPCPIAEINPYTNQTLEDRLQFAIWAKAAVDANAKVMRDVAKINGPIQARDANGVLYEAGYHATAEVKYPASATLDVLKKWDSEQGEKIADKMFIGSTELSPLLKAKKRIELCVALADVAVVKAGSKWKVGKADEDDEA